MEVLEAEGGLGLFRRLFGGRRGFVIEREVQGDLLVAFLAVAELFGRFGQDLDWGFEFVLDLLLDRVDHGGRSVQVVDIFGPV